MANAGVRGRPIEPLDMHNKNPKPFKWTKSADRILASVKRFCHKAQQTYVTNFRFT